MGYNKDQILDAGKRFKEYVETNKKLPPSIKVGSDDLNVSNFLYIACKTVLNLNDECPIDMGNPNKKNYPTDFSENTKEGKLPKCEYLKIARDIIKFIDSGVYGPGTVGCSLGSKVNHATMEWAYAKILNYYKEKGYLPGDVSIVSWETLTGQKLIETVVTKPEPIATLENTWKVQINSMTDLYNLVLNKGRYHHHYCLQWSEDYMAQNLYGNCSEYSRLALQVMKALNSKGKQYTGKSIHVWCKNSSGTPVESLGHYFVVIVGEEFGQNTWFDLAEAASGKGPIGSIMCSRGFEDKHDDGVIC